MHFCSSVESSMTVRRLQLVLGPHIAACSRMSAREPRRLFSRLTVPQIDYVGWEVQLTK